MRRLDICEKCGDFEMYSDDDWWTLKILCSCGREGYTNSIKEYQSFEVPDTCSYKLEHTIMSQDQKDYKGLFQLSKDCYVQMKDFDEKED